MGSSRRAGLTRLGIIVVTGLNNNVNLRQSKDLAWKWLRGLAANAALDPVHETSMPSHVHTRRQDIHTQRVHAHTHTHRHYAVILRFPIKTYERLLKTHGRIPLVLCQA